MKTECLTTGQKNEEKLKINIDKLKKSTNSIILDRFYNQMGKFILNLRKEKAKKNSNLQAKFITFEI